MKIFETGSKVNFVDENNVFVGYDLDSCCCEYADWFIKDTPQETYQNVGDEKPDVSNFFFDKGFFQEVNNESVFDGGGMAIFRLTDGGKDLYLHIFNAQNGYYGHGFEFGVGNEVIKEGVL